LASEWFTVWGDAYRNPDRQLLMNAIRDRRDNFGNSICELPSTKRIASSTLDFEELSEKVKEFLSKVPNLYVEDAAVASGKFLETRIRSITNDPATALALKTLLVFSNLYSFVLCVAPYASPSSPNSPSFRSDCCPWNERVFRIDWHGYTLTCLDSPRRR